MLSRRSCCVLTLLFLLTLLIPAALSQDFSIIALSDAGIGAHRFTVQAKDSAGLIFKQTINITLH